VLADILIAKDGLHSLRVLSQRRYCSRESIVLLEPIENGRLRIDISPEQDRFIYNFRYPLPLVDFNLLKLSQRSLIRWKVRINECLILALAHARRGAVVGFADLDDGSVLILQLSLLDVGVSGVELGRLVIFLNEVSRPRGFG
jgi:hypothetical protein